MPAIPPRPMSSGANLISLPANTGDPSSPIGQGTNNVVPIQRAVQATPESQDHAAAAIDSLAAMVRKKFFQFRDHRQRRNIDTEMLESLRAYDGQYDPGRLAEIRKFSGSDVYARVTTVKCRAATAMLRDVFLSSTQPWGIVPTPVPSLPDEVGAQIGQLIQMEAQQLQASGQPVDQETMNERHRTMMSAAEKAAQKNAAAEAKKAEKYLADRLVEGDFMAAFTDFLIDLPIYQFAAIKGPVVQVDDGMEWRNGVMTPTRKPVMHWKRVSPFDLYFSPGATRIEEAEVIERIRMPRPQLNRLIGLPGYNEEAIRNVLHDYDRGIWEYLDNTDTERAYLTKTEYPTQNTSELLDGLEYHGTVQGQQLLDFGFAEAQILDPLLDYAVTLWVIGRYTIKAQINPNPRKRHPYYATSFEKTPGSLYGKGLPLIIGDLQDVANASLRALVNNLCLTGDTVVYREKQSRAYADVTLAELWAKKQEHNSGLRRIKLRSLNEETGEFYGNRIVDIIDNGEAEVFEITTERGYTIKATGNHRFMREDMGWQTVDEFDTGELIAVNGAAEKPAHLFCKDCGAKLDKQNEYRKNPSVRCHPCAQRHRRGPRPTCIDCGAGLSKKPGAKRCRSCASQHRNNKWNAEQIARARENRGASATTARYRKEVQMQREEFCERCGIPATDLPTKGSGRLNIHHKDGDPWNNVENNLVTLCPACHRKLHAKEASFGDPYLHRYLSFDRIISIVSKGKQQVYDLSMEAPDHNFIANGFVSHNSISSGPQVSIDEDRLSPTTDGDSLYPWKRWRFVSDPYGGTRDPISFFQPKSNAGELLSVYSAMMDISDEVSAIPRYLTGDESIGGAGRTASGLSMLMQNASRVMQNIAASIDRDIMQPLLQQLYDIVMLTAPPGTLRGDEQIQVKGVAVAQERETNRMRQLEFLQMTGANPVDMQIMGVEGRAEILRNLAKELGMSGESIIPGERELAQATQQMAAMAPEQANVNAGQVGAPTDAQTRMGAETDNAQRVNP